MIKQHFFGNDLIILPPQIGVFAGLYTYAPQAQLGMIYDITSSWTWPPLGVVHC